MATILIEDYNACYQLTNKKGGNGSSGSITRWVLFLHYLELIEDDKASLEIAMLVQLKKEAINAKIAQEAAE